MTFKEFMKEVGYNPLTTFWEDFGIADKYGMVGVKDTYRRAFGEWKDERVRIKLSQNVDEATDDTIFFCCNGLEELKSLAEFGGEDFMVTDFWNFIDKSDDYEKDSDNR